MLCAHLFLFFLIRKYIQFLNKIINNLIKDIAFFPIKPHIMELVHALSEKTERDSLVRFESMAPDQRIPITQVLKLVTPTLEKLGILNLDRLKLTSLRLKSNLSDFPAMKNDVFLRVFRDEPIDHVPVWMMRQAGRALPEFNEVRKSLSFFDLCDNPFGSTEVTLQPLQRYQIDAAIIFSDILIVPKVMGLDFVMEVGKGPQCVSPLKTIEDLKRLKPVDGTEISLTSNYDAIFLTRMALNGSVPLIGFCGSPWTLMVYMVEGTGSANNALVKKWINMYPEESKFLLNAITKVLILHMSNQIKAGAQAIQIFDSSAELLSPEDYFEFSLPYAYATAAELKKNFKDIPIIFFPRGQYGALKEILTNPMYKVFDCVGLNHGVNIQEAREWAAKTGKVLQGNLDPGVIMGSEKIIEEKTKKMVENFGCEKYIANLGHGVWPGHEINKLQVFVNTVREHSAKLLNKSIKI